MSADTWLDDNNRYLAASLQWLRLRLAMLLAPGDDADSPRPHFWNRTVRTPADAAGQLAAAAEQRKKLAACDPPPALELLAQRLGMSPFERDTLLLCAAAEYDPALPALCARIQGGPARGNPSFSLALSAFDDPAWDAISAHRPLRHARLVEPDLASGLPLTACALRPDERIVHYLKGLNALDPRVASLLAPVAETAPLAPSQQAVADRILERLRLAAQDAQVPVVQLLGDDDDSRLGVAQQVSAALGRRLYRLDIGLLAAHNAEPGLLARLWQRESILLPVALYVDADHADTNSVGLRSFLGPDMGVVFVAVRETPLTLAAPSFAAEVARPVQHEQFAAWLEQLADAPGERTAAAQQLAGQFSLNLGRIRAIGALAARAGEDAPALPERLWDASRELLRPRLDALAQRLEPKAGWDDLVLPDEQTRIMRAIAAQVRERYRVYGEWGFGGRMNRGFGVSALFAGESGTGKTMAAEVIAKELRLNLYRIDLSAVVSKYIGETEKNLRRLFDAAEQGGAILFFDEADALFGKRSEVKDSHDRYANIEINYLLQRMESFSGLAILATNMKSALDPAFMRRLRFIVNFPFPGVPERLAIWRRALPAPAPVEDLDFARLARLNISGGNIHSIALNAAFMAAHARQPVGMAALLAAARDEMKKLDKPLSEAALR